VRGHRTVAVELPADDPAKGLHDYAHAIHDQLGDTQDDDVVLVGHSLAGISVPLVADLRPISRIVLIAALVPRIGQSLIDQLRGDDRGVLLPRAGQRRNEDKTTEWIDPLVAIDAMYTDVDPQRAAAAFAHLRPQAAMPQLETTPLAHWPDVPTEYLVCAQDRMIDPDYQRRAPFPQRVLTSAHSPMLSQPAELARTLIGQS
jgi:pimeloyl-ACP methyl ester carboxylesterase